MISLKISDSRSRRHLMAHIATAALGIFISFALLPLLSILFRCTHSPPLMPWGGQEPAALVPTPPPLPKDKAVTAARSPLGMPGEGLRGGIPFLMPNISNKLCCYQFRKKIQPAPRSSGSAAMRAPLRAGGVWVCGVRDGFRATIAPLNPPRLLPVRGLGSTGSAEGSVFSQRCSTEPGLSWKG